MPRTGWIRLHRQMLTHAVVGAGSCGKFSKCEAWLWLLINAAFNERKILNRGKEVILQPGEQLAATAFLAKTWKWTVPAVRWFLQQLENNKAITRSHNKDDSQTQRICIVNWAKYQVPQQEMRGEEEPKQQPLLKNKEGRNTFTGGEYWKGELNPEKPRDSADKRETKHTAELVDGTLNVSEALRAHWLPAFGGDRTRLQYALVQVAGYVQPNSHRPLVAQINAQLARIAGIRRDYAATRSSTPTAARQVGHVSSVTVRNTDETFADYRARMLREGKITDNNGTTSGESQ